METVDYVFLGVGLLSLLSAVLDYRSYSRETRNHKDPHTPSLKEFWQLSNKGTKFNMFLAVFYLAITALSLTR